MYEIGRGAGRYSNRVLIQQNQPINDADNQPVQNWVFVANRWAEVLGRGGRVKIPWHQLRAETDYIVHLRSDVLTRQIIPVAYRFQITIDKTTIITLHIGDRYDVDLRRIELEFHCTSRAFGVQ